MLESAGTATTGGPALTLLGILGLGASVAYAVVRATR